ncbi:MAG: chromosome segregation ATPase, partial [Myxococcota bacterium]
RALDGLGVLEGPGLGQAVRTAMKVLSPETVHAEDDVPELPLDDEAAVDVVVVDVEFDDEEAFDPAPTQVLGHVDVVEPLAGEVTLERVQTYATEVVERAGRVAALAKELAERCRNEGRGLGLESAADIDRASSAARRAEKARDSARGASNLVDMDESAAEAQITLTLVHGAARQADVALAAALDALTDVRRSAHRIAGEMERVEEARSEAPEAVTRARSGVRAVARVADAVRSEVASDKLPAGAGQQGLDDLRQRAERALRVAEEAASVLVSATLAEVADAALMRLRDAANAAESAGTAASTLLDTLRADVDRARLEAVDSAARSHRTLEERLKRLTDRLESAQSANAVSPTDEATAAIGRASAIVDILNGEREASAAAVDDAQAADNETDALVAAQRARACLGRVDAQLVLAGERVEQAITATRLAAEALARRDAAQQDAAKAVEQSDAASARVRQVMDQLQEDTKEVQGGSARTVIRQASQAWSELQSAGVEARGHAARVAVAATAEEAQAALSAARSSVAEVTGSADHVLDLARRAREACNRELAEIRRERQAAQALTDAVTEAQKSAELCSAQVVSAQEELGTLSARVTDGGHLEATRLRDVAAEIIDIAAYQASESRDAARQAKTQAHADEASRYADTARSFRERIAEDLPAAHSAMAKATAALDEDVQRRRSAMERLTGFETTVADAQRRWIEVITTARHEARGWNTPDMQSAMSALEGLGPEFDAQVQRTMGARRSAEGAGAASVVESAMGTTHEASARVERLLQRLDGASGALQAALTSARTESDALTEARETVGRCRTQVAAHTDTLRGLLSFTQRNIIPFSARGTAIVEGIRRLEVMVQRAESLVPEFQLLADGVAGASTRTAAEPLANQARAASEELEALTQEAGELSETVVSAAEDESQARANEAKRRRDDAMRIVQAGFDRASEIRDRVDVAIEGAREEVTRSDSDDALDRFAAARRGAMRVGAAYERLADLVERLTHDDPELLSPEVQSLVELAESCAGDVTAAVELAVDSARRAVEEASALQTVRDEVATLGGRARAAVEVTRVRASEVAHLVERAERTSTREVAERAHAAVALAEKAAKKAAAAGPMVALVAELAAAEPIVRAARLSAERAEEVAASVNEILAEANRRMDEERAEADRRLEEARSDARHPLSQARASVARAQGFVTAAETDAATVDSPAIQAALAALRSAADDVRVRAGDTVRIGEGLAAAPDLDAVLDLADLVRLGTDATIAALGEATQRMEAARAAITRRQEHVSAIERAQSDVSDAAMSAQEAATGCRNTLEGLESTANELAELGPAVQQTLADLERVVDDAENAAAKALGLSLEVSEVDRPLLAADMSDQASGALEAAIAALARAVELDRKGREAIDRDREEAARKAAEAVVNERRRLPRRSSGSSRADRLRSRLEASGGAPRPTRENRERYARSRTYNNETSSSPTPPASRDAAAPPPAPRPLGTPPPPPRRGPPEPAGASSEDRIARLRQSLRAAGPAKSRSKRMEERRAGGDSPARDSAASRQDPPAEKLAAPRRESFGAEAKPVPRAARPAPPTGDAAAEARRKKREALRARLRKSRREDED